MTGSAGKEKLSLCLGDLSMRSPKIQGGGGDQEHSVVSWEEHSAMFEFKRISATALSAKTGMGTAGWRGSQWDALKDVKGVSSLSSCTKSPLYKGGCKARVDSQPGSRVWRLTDSPREYNHVPRAQTMINRALSGLLALWPEAEQAWATAEFLLGGAVRSLGSHHSHGWGCTAGIHEPFWWETALKRSSSGYNTSSGKKKISFVF